MNFDFTTLLKELGLAFLIAVSALALSMYGTEVGIELARWERVVLFVLGLVVVVLSYLSTLRVSWKEGQENKGYSRWGKRFTLGGNLFALILLVFVTTFAFVARYPPRTAVPITLPASIKVKISGDGVIPVAFELYTKRVLPNEWFASWPLESLKSGAVAVKTYALYWHQNGGKPPFGPDADICDTTTCQVYNSTKYDNLAAVYKQQIDDAVGQTWSVVFTRGGLLFQPEYWNGRVNVFGTGSVLRIRSSPTLNGIELTNVPDGTMLKIVGSTPINADGWNWWEVATWDNQIRGWAAGAFLRAVDSFGQPMLDSSGMAGRLTQWGTEYWAQQGLGYQDILRHFYADIEFSAATAQ